MSNDETAGRDDRSREDRPLSDQERAELYREQLKQLHVIDLVRDMMVTLVTVGYEKLGLTEQTRELRDLGDARVAIESLRRLIEVVEGEGDPEVASLRSTLAQMQLNFARAAARPHEEGFEAEAHPSVEAEKAPPMAPDSDAAGRRAAAQPEPVAGKAVAGKPATRKPAARKPVANKPATGKPAANKAATRKPAAKKPTARQPAASKPTAKKPTAKRPTAKKPAVE